MKENPINKLLDVSLANINRLVDVSKVIGQPIRVDEEKIVIPVSKVTFGFGAGGSEFNSNNDMYANEMGEEIFPFGGGSGGGVSIAPIGFLSLDSGRISILNIERENSLLEKILNIVDDFIKPGKDYNKLKKKQEEKH